jgi:hypothetical protein
MKTKKRLRVSYLKLKVWVLKRIYKVLDWLIETPEELLTDLLIDVRCTYIVKAQIEIAEILREERER